MQTHPEPLGLLATTPPFPCLPMERAWGGFTALLARTEWGLAGPGHPGLVASLVGHGAAGWELWHGQGLSRGLGGAAGILELWLKHKAALGSVHPREGGGFSQHRAAGLSHSPPWGMGPPIPALLRRTGELKGPEEGSGGL